MRSSHLFAFIFAAAALSQAVPALAFDKCTSVSIQIMPATHDPIIDNDQISMKYGNTAVDVAKDMAVPWRAIFFRPCDVFWRVGSIEEIISKIRGLKSVCTGRCITELNIDSHGSPGSVYKIFNNSDLLKLDRSELDDVRRQFDRGAIIRLLGCSIGQGLAGAEFIENVGYYFLAKNGGEVRAFTEKAIDMPVSPLPEYTSFNSSPVAIYKQFPSDGGGTISYKKGWISTL